MPVTAQDLFNVFLENAPDMEKKLDALISSARQEAVEEYKKSLTHGN